MSKFLSRADLERIAGTVVTQYYQAISHMGTMPAPVDPVALAKVVLGLDTHYLPLSGDGSVLGMACFQETTLEVYNIDGVPFQVELSGRDIVIDCSLQDEDKRGRHNFTAAHELSHHILVRLFPEDYRHLLNCRTHVLYRDTRRSRDWEEWQADVMAAAIIMPAETISCCMEMFGLGKRLDMVSSFCRAKEFERFCDIATYLGVSKKALAIRMKQLGLLGEEYLANPTAPLDIWKDEDDE